MREGDKVLLPKCHNKENWKGFLIKKDRKVLEAANIPRVNCAAKCGGLARLILLPLLYIDSKERSSSRIRGRASALREVFNFPRIKKQAQEDLTSQDVVWFLIMKVCFFWVISCFQNLPSFFSSNMWHTA